MKLFILIFITVLTGCEPGQNQRTIKTKVTLHHDVADTTYRQFSTFNGDTSKYIRQNFIIRASKFEDQPLSFLLDKLEVPIYQYATFGGEKDITVASGISFKFFSQKVIEEKVKRKINPEILLIHFKTNINDTTILNLLRKNKLKWTEDESSFYGKIIVKKIDTIIDPFGPKRLTREQIKLRGRLQKS